MTMSKMSLHDDHNMSTSLMTVDDASYMKRPGTSIDEKHLSVNLRKKAQLASSISSNRANALMSRRKIFTN
jgi:hypothetical protein